MYYWGSIIQSVGCRHKEGYDVVGVGFDEGGGGLESRDNSFVHTSLALVHSREHFSRISRESERRE